MLGLKNFENNLLYTHSFISLKSSKVQYEEFGISQKAEKGDGR